LQGIKLFSVLSICILVSCSVTRRSAVPQPKPGYGPVTSDNAESVARNNVSQYDFFIKKAEISVRDESYSENFNANIRFKRPDSLLISLRSKLGIEAARIFLTSDTLMINDRINKKLILGNTRNLESKYGIDFRLIFTLFGDFIIDKDDESRKLNCVNGIYSDTFLINGRRVDYKADCRRKKITEAYFEGSLTKGNINIGYGRYKNFGGLILPQEIRMMDDLSGLTVNIEIVSAEPGWNGKITFVAGGNYDIIYLK
jgi:hypothetical protein